MADISATKPEFPHAEQVGDWRTIGSLARDVIARLQRQREERGLPRFTPPDEESRHGV